LPQTAKRPPLRGDQSLAGAVSATENMLMNGLTLVVVFRMCLAIWAGESLAMIRPP